MSTVTEKWTTERVAEYLEIKPGTWRHYYANELPKLNPAPKPDGQYDGRTPWWWSTTVIEWDKRRHGKGQYPRAGTRRRR